MTVNYGRKGVVPYLISVKKKKTASNDRKLRSEVGGTHF